MSTWSTARVRPFRAAQKMASLPLTQARTLQQKPSDLGPAEAAPVATEARFETSAVDEISRRRAAAGRLVAGVAAPSNSDMFKASTEGKPKAKRWDHHLTEESLARKPCSLKQAARYLKTPGLISLGGGLPSSELFPIAELAAKVPTVPHFTEKETAEQGQMLQIGKYDARDGHSEYDLSIALNYTQSNGSAQMMRFLTEHTELVCRPPYADWQICQTIGSTGALEQAIRMFCDRNRNDSLLTEAFSFSTALETVEPLGVKTFGCPIDDEGLIPEAMDELLSRWDAQTRGARRPHVLYTVPSGQNPTGATQGPERRRAIYRVAQKHDLIVIEDEPYYFLQMQPYRPAGPSSSSSAPEAPLPSTAEEFLSSLIPTYVSMDTDGRVLRLDSLSKVMIPGSRLGWVTGSAQIIERYMRHAEVASQGPAGLSQVIMHKLLDETWGHGGYFEWLIHLRKEYTAKRDALLKACEEHLPTDLVQWTPPAAGMFLWFTIDHSKHPHASTKTIEQLEEEIFHACIASGVLVARGSWFLAERESPLPGLHFRATFAAASLDHMNDAIKRFGKAVGDSFGEESVK